MRLDYLSVGSILAGTLMVMASGSLLAGPANPLPVVPVDSVQTRPLRFLMTSLGQDMSRVGDGLWREDFTMVEKAAVDIADHPRITPNEVAAIRAALESGFQQFVAIDKVVHQTASQLARAAAQKNLARVLELQGRLQQACVACHTAYRADVRAALY
jgi:hypothetical protein